MRRKMFSCQQKLGCQVVNDSSVVSGRGRVLTELIRSEFDELGAEFQRWKLSLLALSLQLCPSPLVSNHFILPGTSPRPHHLSFSSRESSRYLRRDKCLHSPSPAIVR